MPLNYAFDWHNPDYAAVFRHRENHLRSIRASAPGFAPLIKYYARHPAQMIIDWGVTFDPRNLDIGRPAFIPFVLFPKQEEWVDWAIARWRARERGLTEKSRDSGVSWLAIGLACTLCTTYKGMIVGFGSRKQEYVDELGQPKSLLEKARIFMDWLPHELRAGWNKKTAPQMRIMFPDTGSAITGEIGDSIGRGDRTTLYFVDEAAWLEHPETAETGLLGTTNCRIDVSTPSAQGMASLFAQRRHAGKTPIFTLHWRDDPRKGQAWYERECEKADDPVAIAQEIDINYLGSSEGVLIPSTWVQAAIDAHTRLGIVVTGESRGALDIADEGIDKNAFIGRKGILVNHAESWSGKGSDTYKSTLRAVNLCDDLGYRAFDYDADGMGALVRGDVNAINAMRESESKRLVIACSFRGSASVEGLYDPDGMMVEGRVNRDYFLNLKAQSWWALRIRFRNTYRWVVEGMPCDPDEIISLDSTLPELTQLTMELSQPKYVRNEVGKLKVDKQPKGTKSPNLADGVMMVYNPTQRTEETWMRIAEMA